MARRSAKFALTVIMDNAAFHDYNSASHAYGGELARILRTLASRLEDAAYNGEGHVLDYNGNSVAAYKITGVKR